MMNRHDADRRDSLSRTLSYGAHQIERSSEAMERLAELLRAGRDNEVASALRLIRWQLSEHVTQLDALLAQIIAGRMPN